MTTNKESFQNDFRNELMELLDNIDESLKYMGELADRNSCSLFALRHTDGSFAAERLLAAKAQVLSTLALLETKT